MSRYLALQLNHAPLQVEQRYMALYPPDQVAPTPSHCLDRVGLTIYSANYMALYPGGSQFWDQRIMNAISTFCEPRNISA